MYQHDVVLNHIFMISLYSLSEVKKLEKSCCKKNECKADSVLTSVQLFDSLIVRLLAQMQNNQECEKKLIVLSLSALVGQIMEWIFCSDLLSLPDNAN